MTRGCPAGARTPRRAVVVSARGVPGGTTTLPRARMTIPAGAGPTGGAPTPVPEVAPAKTPGLNARHGSVSRCPPAGAWAGPAGSAGAVAARRNRRRAGAKGGSLPRPRNRADRAVRPTPPAARTAAASRAAVTTAEITISEVPIWEVPTSEVPAAGAPGAAGRTPAGTPAGVTTAEITTSEVLAAVAPGAAAVTAAATRARATRAVRTAAVTPAV